MNAYKQYVWNNMYYVIKSAKLTLKQFQFLYHHLDLVFMAPSIPGNCYIFSVIIGIFNLALESFGFCKTMKSSFMSNFIFLKGS